MDANRKYDFSLTEQDIKSYLKKFNVNNQNVISTDPNIRVASVLVPLFCKENSWHLLFTRRTDSLQFHKGQVSFPGGVSETSDKNEIETALRESFEEISLKPGEVKVLGCLPKFTSHTNYHITPVVGRIQWPVDLKPNPDEVKKIFTIPLKWLGNDENKEWKAYQSSDGRIDQVIFYKPYQGEKLWGITARITVTLLKALHLIK